MAKDDIEKINNILLFSSIVVLLLGIYYHCFTFFNRFGLSSQYLNNIIVKIVRLGSINQAAYIPKIYALILLAMYCIALKPRPQEHKNNNFILISLTSGLILFFGSELLFSFSNSISLVWVYIIFAVVGYLLLLSAGIEIRRRSQNLKKDIWNEENESFPQEERLLRNEMSVNLPTKYFYGGKERKGWINIINPFRATLILGTPGSGKTFSVIEPAIRQMIDKGFAMYIYDYKFPSLGNVAYNHLINNYDKYTVKPTFWVINMDNPRKSHRCNPLAPELMTDIADAFESAYTIMLNLNKTWIQKQGDFFVESSITLLTGIIWFLKQYDGGRYCTFPHAIEMLNQSDIELFQVLMNCSDVKNYLSSFESAMQNNAQDQLQGQIASARIPLSRISSPALYWVMTGDDFSLDINNPTSPKILTIANNPSRQSIYSAALGLYNSSIVRIINQKNKHKCAIVIDELPTIYFRGLDNLIATARSNKVATLLGIQDFSQLNRDYGDKESKVIKDTVGNIVCGQVVGDTAKAMSERFGKVVQKRESMNFSREDTSVNISTQLDYLIPAAKISNLTQGQFVGSVADEFGVTIKQKVFNAIIDLDIDGIFNDQKRYTEIPQIANFEKDGKDVMDEVIIENFKRIKSEANNIIEMELQRIRDEEYEYS